MEIEAFFLYQLVLHFQFERTEKTQVPIELTKGLVGLGAEKGIHLRLKIRV